MTSQVSVEGKSSSPFRLSLFDGSMAPNHDGVNVRIRNSFVCFSRIKKMLGRTEMQTHDSKHLLSVATNSLGHLPRRLSKNCDLRQTDRFRFTSPVFWMSMKMKTSYNIDIYLDHFH